MDDVLIDFMGSEYVLSLQRRQVGRMLEGVSRHDLGVGNLGVSFKFLNGNFDSDFMRHASRVPNHFLIIVDSVLMDYFRLERVSWFEMVKNELVCHHEGSFLLRHQNLNTRVDLSLPPQMLLLQKHPYVLDE